MQMYVHMCKSWDVKCDTVNENDIFKMASNCWRNSGLEMDLSCKVENVRVFAYLPIYTDELLKL